VAFSRDGRTLVSTGGDTTIRLWGVHPRNLFGTALATGDRSLQNSVAFSPDGRSLALSTGTTIRLWDLHTHKQLGSLAASDLLVSSLAFSPNGRTLASTSGDGRIELWDVRARKRLSAPLRRDRNAGFGFGPSSLAFNRDGRTLASTNFTTSMELPSHTRIDVWDMHTHKPLGRPLGGKQDVTSVAFGRDDMLASAGRDGTIRLWDVRTHNQLGESLTGHNDAVESVVFSPDGRTLASGSWDETIRLWDVHTHKPLGAPLTGHKDAVESVAFSPDGRTLASGSRDKTIRLWDVRTHRELGTRLTGHKDDVHNVVFSPDGRTLASAGERTIRVWEKLLWRNFAELQSEVCSLVGTALSTTEWEQYASGIDYRRSCP
jgi:predicted NACHT family NTPase